MHKRSLNPYVEVRILRPQPGARMIQGPTPSISIEGVFACAFVWLL